MLSVYVMHLLTHRSCFEMSRLLFLFGLGMMLVSCYICDMLLVLGADVYLVYFYCVGELFVSQSVYLYMCLICVFYLDVISRCTVLYEASYST